MAYQTLLRRRAQHALLVSACKQGVPARVGLRRKTATTGDAHLVALERDGVLVTWVDEPIPEVEAPGQPVEVRFEHGGEHYVFFAVTRGRVGQGLGCCEAPRLMRLSLPLRLERARRRQRRRMAVKNLPATVGTFTHVVDERRQFQAQLTDLADGGIGVTARATDVPPLYTGDLFWVDMALPGEKSQPEFVARLVHLRPIKGTDTLAMGWAFQPTDDVANYEKYLRRLETLIGRQQAPGRPAGPC